MPKTSVKYSDDIAARVARYNSRHGIPDVSTFIRLAMLTQLQQPPPDELPDAALGNPVGNHTLTAEKAREMRAARDAK